MYLTEKPIDFSSLAGSVMVPACGALVTFSGVVRDHHQGKQVESIFYEAYRPMAEKELARIVDEVTREFPGVRVALRHRLGLVPVGEASIVIACASPHRSEAFDASRALIDRIKGSVPIWKKERSPEGDEWVGWQK